MIHHSPPPGQDGSGPDVAQAEAWLADWFDCPVVLASSGRAALRVAFAELGLNRYKHRIAISPMTAMCVFDAVVRHGFPVDPASGGAADATLLIEQYGVVQRWRPEGAVVEDICHAFFAGAETGARDWAGEMAVFSLPKFLSVAGMAGGIVVRSPDLEARLRARIGVPRARIADERRVFREGSGAALEAMYLQRLLDPAPDPEALAGLPEPGGLRAIGTQRAEIVARLLDTPAAAAMDSDWRTALTATLPYALPLFGDPDDLARRDAALTEAGVQAGIYRVDHARDNRAPDWRPALLVPCYHAIPTDQLAAIEQVLA